MKRILFFLIAISFATTVFAKKSNEKLLTVIYTNDGHGLAWKFNEPGDPGIGGLAARKTLIDKIREEVEGKGGHVLVVSGGDITLGDPRSNICHNMPLIKGMNLIGYDAMVIGNHEFDFGLKVFNEMKNKATFPWLSANIYKNGGTQPVTNGYIEKKYSDGLKVGIIGLTTRETEQITGSGLEGKLVMTNPIQEAKTRIPLLRKKDDIIIVLSHLGFYPTDKSFDGFYGDTYLAKAVKGINLIVGGHTQIQLNNPVKIGDTYIVQTEGYGKWVGRVDFYLKGKKIVKVTSKLYPINLKKKTIKNGKTVYEYIDKKIPENKAMLDMLNGFQCNFSRSIIGKTKQAFSGDRLIVRYKESKLGDIITDIMKNKVKADIAMINGGSIRQGITKGAIRESDIYNVFPFSDTLYLASMTGAQIQQVLDFFAERGAGTGGFLQVAGITMKIYKGAALEIKINGQPLKKKKKYKVALNSFLAEGGDGYTMLEKLKTKKNTGYSMPQLLVEYIKLHKTFKNPKTGRIKIVR
jgi:5'-nucleotidase/UDP-sugar diphosphatase